MERTLRLIAALSLMAAVVGACDYLRRSGNRSRATETRLLEEALETFENEGGLVAA